MEECMRAVLLRAVWWTEALHWNHRRLGQNLQGGGRQGLLQGVHPSPQAWQGHSLLVFLLEPRTLSSA